MPCSDGFPDKFSDNEIKNPSEAVKTLWDHHMEVEKELEALREYSWKQQVVIKEFFKLFPKKDFSETEVYLGKRPEQCKNWKKYKWID